MRNIEIGGGTYIGGGTANIGGGSGISR